MPLNFIDGVMFIILGTVGLLGGLFTQLSLVTHGARVKAMRDNESEKEAVKKPLRLKIKLKI